MKMANRCVQILGAAVMLCAAAIAAITPASATIKPGNVSNNYYPQTSIGGIKAGGGAAGPGFQFTHTSIGNYLVVGCSNDQYPEQQVLSVTAGGRALQQQGIAKLPFESGQPLTYLFSGFAPVGVITVHITVTTPATTQHGHGTACFAEDFSGVNAAAPVWSVHQTNCGIGQNCMIGSTTSSGTKFSQTVQCEYKPDADGEVVVMYMYSTLYGPSDDATELIHASPAVPNPWYGPNPQETGPFAAPQAAMAVSDPLTKDVTFVETWSLGIPVHDNLPVQTSIIALVLYP